MAEISVNPERIDRHSAEVKGEVREALDKALSTLNAKGTIEGGDFSITGTMSSMAYPMGLQFAYEDLNAHLQTLDTRAQTLARTAENYRGAETSSTVKPV